ncbi:putative ABC transport system ATP-binding protein [Mycoplasmopsis mustelae]|uniref:Putative ABC transport system ATP-binding protein n=1 Tax=Mycoplasmopsis mustelae TaxID=171289 RepID=A0A4R7UFL7_9BACT|nr:ABC transporter ATP-binding protein [Mycoplasmopsis mustelae]TDV24415.1 putative ABC transport system ATP-binding protein [Mycoplasmopsis mustelae]
MNQNLKDPNDKKSNLLDLTETIEIQNNPNTEPTVLFKKNSDVRITRKNVYDFLDAEGGFSNLVVDRSIARILKRAANKKRPRDDHKDLKNTEDNIIEVKNVSKYYLSGNTVTRVLKNISLKIKKGEFIMIFGKSGGGKSTLLNLISGLDRPSRGDVIVCNENLPYLSDLKLTLFRRKNVSFIFQNYNLLQNLSGYDNVQTGAYLQKNPDAKLDIDQLFTEFDMEDVKSKYPSQMSGGQQQRISILRALAKNSDIIFADEPTAALDEKTTSIVLSYLYDINKKYGTTIVMVTHNPAIEAISDRIIHIQNGKIRRERYNKNPVHPNSLKWED